MPDFPFAKRAIHLDFHTMPGVYDVGRDFDAAQFAATLSDAGVDYITVFAKCNLGFAYYPTQVGIVHPGLQAPDLLGPMVSACHERGIRIAAYINTGLDHECSVRHRDWLKLNAHGQVYEMERMGHFFRRMCLNTPYARYTLDMVEEVLDRYPVDGIFLDCFTNDPCYGGECIDGMRALGMDVTDEAQVMEYGWLVTQRFCGDVEQLVRRKGRDINIYFNGLPYRNEPTHLELEVLPTGGWGYDYLPWAIRYARTLKRPYFTMTGRFHKSWGDFGGLRPYQSLLYDCYYSIANGGTCSVGDHMHPRGPLDTAVYATIGQAYAETRKLDPWTEGARSEAEIAVVAPMIGHYTRPRSIRDSVSGAARMLVELKQQFDVCDGEGDLSPYRVLILPDDVAMTLALQAKLEAHLARGGRLIASAAAGLDAAQTAYALSDYPATYEGAEPHDPAFFVASPEVAQDLPAMPVTIYSPGVAMRAAEGATVLARLIKPYFNRATWDWRHEDMYMPPEGDTGRPALVVRGPIYHFGFPVFRAYFEHAVVAYRTLLGNCLALALPEPLVRVRNMPSFGQVTVTAQGAQRMVHLLAYVPELRGPTHQMIEEPIAVAGVEVELRSDGRKVERVYLAPSGEVLSHERAGDYVRVIVPQVVGYQMVVFEE
jgi:hypothetical protein